VSYLIVLNFSFVFLSLVDDTSSEHISIDASPVAALVSYFISTPSDQLTKVRPANYLGQAAIANHKVYAARHGHFHLTEANCTTPDWCQSMLSLIHPAAWAKIFLLAHLFGNPIFSRVGHWAWLDADVLFWQKGPKRKCPFRLDDCSA
jgi:hypothetical protein